MLGVDSAELLADIVMYLCYDFSLKARTRIDQIHFSPLYTIETWCQLRVYQDIAEKIKHSFSMPDLKCILSPWMNACVQEAMVARKRKNNEDLSN